MAAIVSDRHFIVYKRKTCHYLFAWLISWRVTTIVRVGRKCTLPGIKHPGRFSPALVLRHIDLVAPLVGAVDAREVRVAGIKEVRP